MTKPRSQQIIPERTQFYHCMSRCVRQSYLCGDNPATQQNFDHRKQWLVDRVKQLAQVFTIDICAFAVMSNHYHLVLHLNQPLALQLTDHAVIERWCSLYKTLWGCAI